MLEFVSPACGGATSTVNPAVFRILARLVSWMSYSGVIFGPGCGHKPSKGKLPSSGTLAW